jgi:hypothetical protein
MHASTLAGHSQHQPNTNTNTITNTITITINNINIQIASTSKQQQDPQQPQSQYQQKAILQTYLNMQKNPHNSPPHKPENPSNLHPFPLPLNKHT